MGGALHAHPGACSTFIIAGGPAVNGVLKFLVLEKMGQRAARPQSVGLSFPVLWPAVKIPPAEWCWSVQFLLGRWGSLTQLPGRVSACSSLI